MSDPDEKPVQVPNPADPAPASVTPSVTPGVTSPGQGQFVQLTLREARLNYIAEQSMSAMPEEVFAERAAWCEETGDRGVHVQERAGLIEMWWGGQLLAMLEPEALEDDALERRMIDMQEIPGVDSPQPSGPHE